MLLLSSVRPLGRLGAGLLLLALFAAVPLALDRIPFAAPLLRFAVPFLLLALLAVLFFSWLLGRFGQVFDAIADGVIVCSADGRIRRVNPALVAILGTEADALVGRPIVEVLDLGPFASATASPQADIETRGLVEDGKDLPLSVSRAAVLGRRGKVIGWVFTARDIRARLEQSSALTQARDAAELVAKVNTGILATMSHEIRTPLSAVSGLTNIVLDTALDREQRSMLESVRESSDALLETINTILDYSKAEAGELRLEDRPFTLRRTVQSAVDLLLLRAQEKGVALRFQIADDVPEQLQGDEARLRQVLVNLVGNAVKFTEIGSVTVFVRWADPAHRSLQFGVRDSGIGIDGAAFTRLFEPFQQADASTGRRFGGTGLGLAISRRLVEMMGGRIWAQSSPGKGSTFHFTIPVKEPASAARPKPAGPLARGKAAASGFDKGFGNRHDLRVLVAEDNDLNRNVVRLFLERLGIAADYVASGSQALEAQARQPYDVILMDIQMPGIDGLEAAQKIRQRYSPTARPWMVAMTAHALEGSREEFLAGGLDDYLSKPFHVEELKAALLRGEQAGRANRAAAALVEARESA